MESNAADPAPRVPHLRAARVDLDGHVVATGTIQYPLDEGGVFPLPAHDCLSLRINAMDGELSAVRARRDDRTGFMNSSRLGPVLYLPPALCAVLYRVLCFGCSEPVSVVLDDHRGFLQFTVKDNDPGPLRQGLSDWRLEAKSVGGTIKVDLSAALFSSESPVPYPSGSVPQYWSGGKQAAPRLTTTFEVDLITRAVYFGTYEESLGAAMCRMPIERKEFPLSTGPKLATALFGTVGHIYAAGHTRPWVGISTGGTLERQLVFSHFDSLTRNDTGLVEQGRQVFPRVWLDGLDLTTVAGLIRRSPKTRIVLEDGNFGLLDDPPQDRQDYEAGVNVDRSIERALLDFELDERGLHCSYRVFCRSWRPPGTEPGWFEGACTLGWEILIVCFPEIATRWRRRFLDLPDGEEA